MLSSLGQPIPGDLLVVMLLLSACLVTGWWVVGRTAKALTGNMIERCLLYCLLGMVIISSVGVILAALGLFRWWLLVPLVIGWIIVASDRYRSPRPTDSPGRNMPPIVQVGIGLVFLAAIWLYARPAERFLLLDDASVYTIGGIALARDGSLFYEPDELLLPDAQGEAIETERFWQHYSDFIHQFYSFERTIIIPSRHFGPFYHWAMLRHEVEIGFLSLPKVWPAIATWIGGARRAISSTPLWGVIGLTLIATIGCRTSGWRTGVYSLLFMGISLPQIWFSRLPVSEVYAQVLILIGIYLLMLARQRLDDPVISRRLVHGSSIAVALLTVTRFEGALLLALLAVLLSIVAPDQREWRKKALIPWLWEVVILGIIGGSISMATAPYYLFTRIMQTVSPQMARAMLTIVLAAGMIVLTPLRRHIRRVSDLARRPAPWVPVIGWVVWGFVAIWQMFARPLEQTFPGWLVQYLTPPVLILGIVGGVWISWPERHDRRPEIRALSGLCAVLLILYSINPMVTAVHPWAIRRIVPIILPVLMLGVGHVTDRLPALLIHRNTGAGVHLWISQSVGILITCGVLLALGRQSLPLVPHRDYDGLWGQLAALADDLPPDSILLFDEQGLGRHLTPPMEIVFGRPSLILTDTGAIQSASTVTDNVINRAIEAGRPVYLIVTGGNLEWRSARWDLVARGGRRLGTPVLHQASGRPPRATDIMPQAFLADVYQIVPARTDPESIYPIHISAGAGSHPYLREGFYGIEWRDADTSFRWTDGNARITVPWSARGNPITMNIRLDISGWRPQGEQQAELAIEVGEEVIFSQPLDPTGDQEIVVSHVIDRDVPEIDIRLISDTWRPDRFSGGTDQRDLGIVFMGMDIWLEP
ncbi:MAG: hypothetical protein ACOX9A_04995 [Anaerolineae bacterium]|jgi:hypothetical protein